MVPGTVEQKLRFARVRLADLSALIQDNRLAADPDARHQVTQEFFFHAVGAIEYVAQLVNERRSLSLEPEDVAVYKVVKRLKPTDPLLAPLKGLSANPRRTLLPQDPYSDKGLIYRIINYRNEVAHRSTDPFHFVLSAGPRVAFLWLDPRHHARGQSTRPVDIDLSNMLTVVDRECGIVLGLLR
jgi:hypothetical protein